MKAEDYFNGKSLYIKLFRQARQTYRRYGRLTGTFRLDELLDTEKQQLAAFLSVPAFRIGEKKRIRWSRFEEAYAASRFASEPLVEVMEHVLGVSFRTRSEIQAQQASNEDRFRQRIKSDFPVLSFLCDMDAWKPLYEWYTENKKEALDGLHAIQKAMTRLPEKLTRLPYFSHRITGNPHTFDLNGRVGKIFLHVLHVTRKREHPNGAMSRTEYYHDLLLAFNLVRDDIMNFASVNGLLAESGGKVHPMWRAAAETHVSWNVPLRHLLDVENIYPVHGKEVYLVENSGVFSTFLDACPNLPLVCTNGQFRLATWLLLEKMTASGCTLHYSGDYDPEGLQMADQVLRRFDGCVRLWGMDLDHYLASHPAVPLSRQRLLKLNTIQSDGLRPLAAQLQSIKRAGYQEAVSGMLLEKVKEEAAK
ncbi:TIGR02679 family protein [Sporolactobacillus sp. THM7-7]|nr:TIGR02679 family protein [Sporolactobacillus sp. THM7-7]